MIIFGNMVIDEKKDHVALKMNTVIDGNPGCLFTYYEIEKLAAHLQSLANSRGRKVDLNPSASAAINQFEDLLG